MPQPLIDSILQLFERDINKLIKEIKAYSNEESLWQLKGDILNRPGNLAIHLAGNLQHFIGAQLGNTGYVRNRPNEFNARNISRSDILSELDKAMKIVQSVLSELQDEDLAKIYPLEVFGYPMTVGYFLVHLHGHLNYHLGQINYHRRMEAGV